MQLKKRLILAVRIIVPVVLLAWIAQQVRQEINDPVQLRRLFELRNLPGLGLAVIPYLAAIILTFWRWTILVLALKIPFRFRDAMRLGFVGYFLQFLSLGAVGGDLFKAVFLARERPDHRPEAVATVFIDRAVGLFGLLLLTCAALITIGWSRLPPQMHMLAITCFIVTAIAILVVAGLLWTGATTRPLRRLLRRFPQLCAVLLRGERALQLYRHHRISFVLAVMSAILSHCLLASSAYFAARITTDHPPTYGEQVVMWNIAGAVGTLPLSPGGLGTFEAAYFYLYKTVPLVPAQNGAVVAITLRVVSIIVAGIGVIVYWCSRGEMRQLMSAAKDDEQALHHSAGSSEKG